MDQQTVIARTRRFICTLGGLAFLATATLGLAQMPPASTDKSATKGAPAANGNKDTMMPGTAGMDASGGMHDSMMGMMKNMESMKMTGDADRDFAMMMKVHHQGAIDMAQMQLKSGKDAKMRAVAKRIIEAQRKEIKEFDQWLGSRK